MLRLTAVLTMLALPVQAKETLTVVTDIAPVESLVALVAGNQAEVQAILPPGLSPHHLSLRPSQARALASADLVVWIGPVLTPALEETLSGLAAETPRLTLSETDGTLVLKARDAEDLDPAHDDHDAHDDDGHHHHGGIDPHMWLSPDNARNWIPFIVQELTALDPDHAEIYRDNAKNALIAVNKATQDARAALADVAGQPLVVYHDAFRYFEAAFDLQVIGAVSDSEAAASGPRGLASLRDRLALTPPACLLTEPGAKPGLIAAIDAADVPRAELDPLGAGLPQGAALYPALLRDMATKIADCAAGKP